MLDAAHLTDRIRPMRRSGGLFLGFESQILRCWVERGVRQVEILDPEQIMKACLLAGGQIQATETPFPDWLDQISQTFLRDMPVQRDALLQKCPLSLPEDPTAIHRFDQALRLLQEPEEDGDLNLRLKLDDLRLFKPTDPRLGLGVRLTTDGVLLGKGLRLARLSLQPDGTLRLVPDGGRERVLTLLSLACDQALDPLVLKQFSYAERALNDGDLSRAGIALAHIGVWPPLCGDDPQDLRLHRLDQIAAAEQTGAPWAKIAKTLRQSGLLKYSPDQPRVPAGEPDGGQWTDAGGGGGSQNAVTPEYKARQSVEGPAAMAQVAAGQEGSYDWSYFAWDGMLFHPGTNKCNLFVADVIVAAGLPQPTVIDSNGRTLLNGLGTPRIPSAGEWGSPNVVIPGWDVVTIPPGSIQPGDVIAEAHQSRWASGHVGIAVSPTQTASASAAERTKDENGNETKSPRYITAGRIDVNSWGHDSGQNVVVRRYVGTK